MTATRHQFQLDEWFDTTDRIDACDTDLVEAQLCLRALHDGIDPDGDEATKTIRQMRAAVKQHNRKFGK